MIKQHLKALKFSGMQRWSTNLLWVGATVGILLLTYGLRVWDVGSGDLGFDEVATYFIANRSLGGVIRYVIGASREHPPLYYMIMSLWFRAAGTEEFVVRYPSALIAVLCTAWGIYWGRRFLGKDGGWWSGLLFAVMPFSIAVGRNARMYTLVMLLSLLTVGSWWQWLKYPTAKRWGIFLALSVAGAVTHYYLVFLWAVEGAILLLFPKRTRSIRWQWIATVAFGLLLLSLLLLASSGMRATLRETGGRFPIRTLRLFELKEVLMDLYLNWHYKTLWTATAIGIGFTVIGWGLVWRKSHVLSVLLALWALIPISIVFLIPETMRARYMLPAFPALVLGLASMITLLRPHLLRILAALLMLVEFGVRLDHVYLEPDTSFSRQIEQLHQFALPGDALVLNGPWPALLLNYYASPDYLDTYLVPQSAPPGFIAETDIPRLEKIAADHERIWVSYGAVQSADPEYRASLWFAENLYNVYRFRDLLLYLRPPETMYTVVEDLKFGEKLQIQEVKINLQDLTPGDMLFVQMACECEELNWRTSLKLALLDQNGHVWDNYESYIGPRHHAQSLMPDQWVEQRALWLSEPGLPPGEYTLALRVRNSKGEVIQEADSDGEWTSLQTLKLTNPVTSSETLPSPPYSEEIPQWAGAEANFADQLQLVGVDPESKYILQGSPLVLRLWWRSLLPIDGVQLRVRLSGYRDTEPQYFDLAPTFYPVEEWQTGEIIQQEIAYQVPKDLRGGRYHLQVQLVGEDGEPLSVAGSRESLTFWEYLKDGARVGFEGAWADLYLVMVGARERDFRVPLFIRRQEAQFGDILALRGYRLSRSTLSAGQSAKLVVYWQALASPDRRYAVFNHLVGPDGTIVWQQDSWPREGQYTTEYWITDEVVDESYQLSIPEGTPPGEYTLYTGVYDPETMVRLLAFDGQGQQYLNDMVPLCTVQVK